MSKNEYRKKIQKTCLILLIISSAIAYFSLKPVILSWHEYNQSVLKDDIISPLLYTFSLGFVGLIAVIVALSTVKDFIVAEEPKPEPKKVTHNFNGFTIVRPYSPKLLKTLNNNVMVFDSREQKILIGNLDLSVGTFTKIPYSCVMDYKIVSDESVLYSPTLGGVIMWGAAATLKKNSTINNVTIKIYASNITNTIIFPIAVNEKIKKESSEFKHVESELDKFIRSMKLVEKNKL